MIDVIAINPMKTVSEKLASFAERLTFESLAPSVVHEAKRFLLDTLGCAIGGYGAQDCKLVSSLIRELGGRPESTIIGDAYKTSCSNAALVNSLMVRVLDFNDTYWGRDPSHPSDIIPAAIAVGERQHSTGKDLLTAIILGYELEIRLCDTAIPGLRRMGWHHATLTQLVSPIVAGKILGLSMKEIVNAIGISGSHNATLGEITTGKLTQMKNLADPLAVQSGVVAALLAQKGFTAPATIFEGKQGFCRAIAGKCDFEKLTENLGKKFRIAKASLKPYCSEFLTHSPITAVLRLVKDYDLKTEDIVKITVRTTSEAIDILADPSKYTPTSKETADHSLPYCIAVAVIDRAVGPHQFLQEKIGNPKILDLASRVEARRDARLEKLFPTMQPAIVKIKTKQNRLLSYRVDYPKGNPRLPMTEQEVQNKFKMLSSNAMNGKQMDRIINAVYHIEHMDDVKELMELLGAF